ncbi:hypothetical protein, partial [Pseudomonas aeruginosa]
MHQPENPARRTLLAQTVAGSAALALGSLLGGARSRFRADQAELRGTE